MRQLSSLLVIAATTVGVASADASDHWAVLVAGSNTYANYRHQADIFHAYQIVSSQGIPKENIITMAYDDIASAAQNPFPGKVFNKPTPDGTPGVDVYDGVTIDYSGDDVTPDNFVNVLTGVVKPPPTPEPSTCESPFSSNKTTCPASKSCCCTKNGIFGCKADAWVCCDREHQKCGGSSGCQDRPTPKPSQRKVLKSTNVSRVFVNFVDHGGSGIIAFPRQQMSSKTLVNALTTMHSKGMYKELVFYLEACESGSMFQDLPKDINIFATTAADATEPSWGTYCQDQAVVDGKNMNTCLGDLYSVSWMEDADLHKPGETLAQQYKDVKQRTNKSHVTEFGTETFTKEPTSNFIGNTSAADGMSDEKAAFVGSAFTSSGAGVTIDSRDAELQYAFAEFQRTQTEEAATALSQIAERSATVHKRFSAISQSVVGRDVSAEPKLARIDTNCQHEAITAYFDACIGGANGAWSSAELGHAATLAKLCNAVKGDHTKVVSAIQSQCPGSSH